MTHAREQKRHGRPPNDPSEPNYWESDLHALIAEKCKSNPKLVKAGRVQTNEMARLCGVTRYTVYRWLKGNKTSVSGARKILLMVKGAGGEIAREDLIEFIDI